MTGSNEDVLDALGAAGILPVLRTRDPSRLRDRVHRLRDCGAKAVELTTSIPGWDERLVEFTETMPDLVWGMGTVTEPAVAERALGHGASFLVSPYPVPEVRRAVAGSGTLLIEGGHTPGEPASVAGSGVAKVFPAHVGGTRYLRSLSPVLPGCRLIPSGGTGPREGSDWTAAGAFAVAVGSALLAVDDLAEPFAAAREKRAEVER